MGLVPICLIWRDVPEKKTLPSTSNKGLRPLWNCSGGCKKRYGYLINAQTEYRQVYRFTQQIGGVLIVAAVKLLAANVVLL
jgi:hypothetical protein